MSDCVSTLKIQKINRKLDKAGSIHNSHVILTLKQTIIFGHFDIKSSKSYFSLLQ